MQGEVHDENAFALGGAPGHAGLFGTIDGVLGLRPRAARRLEMLSPAMLAEIRTADERHRTCGWERAFAGWHGGDACSADTIGHTGFTGTGLWIDFERGLGWALLTNRVHPTRHFDSGIAALRSAVGEQLINAWDARETS